jgi:hypothetical protein
MPPAKELASAVLNGIAIRFAEHNAEAEVKWIYDTSGRNHSGTGSLTSRFVG